MLAVNRPAVLWPTYPAQEIYQPMKNMSKIGRLEDISVRSAWSHEAHDFTPWLAQNLDRLGDVLGLSLEPEGVEVAVESFSADILARDSHGRMVLVENQLETTDHKHLGQILTYLSGLEAEVVIWIASEFREPHLSAINWLNENTDRRFSFFAVRLRVVRIGNSAPAPIFDVLARPNEWDRQIQKLAEERTGEMSEIGQHRRKFWRFYLTRYPEDAELGVTEQGTASMWLEPEGNTGLIVSIYKAKDGFGVFLRGPRGLSAAEVQARLAPVAAEFERLVGNVRNIGSDDDHPFDNLLVDSQDESNWEEAVDWLHTRAHVFLSAASKLFGN